jgi:glutamate/tyrosine decarboxylase-like PLP-dependent enzyme
MDIDRELNACFIGPYGENDQLLESLTVEFLRDHVYWRRNLHPEDAPVIPNGANRQPAFLAFESRLRRELHALSAALKRSVPFHSPRYIGHMVSDLLIPGLAAQMLALPYNPNNVSAESAPVTIDMELKAGLQLAAMIGFVADPAREDCAFGHLTSGGTLANVQGLRLALALKAFPVALQAAGVPLPGLPDTASAAFQLAPAASVALWTAWKQWRDALPAKEARDWSGRVEEQRLEQLGLAGFLARHPGLRAPVVFAPSTAHYSWSKGCKLLGLGRDQLRLIPGKAMRLDLDALSDALDACDAAGEPVLMAVGVLGSTEFGTIDPIEGLLDLRDRCAARGQGFAVHIDAAWGGYLASLFRSADGTLRSGESVAEGFRDFPAPHVQAAVGALHRIDSITIDPHKLGYLPYGAGAFLCRDQRAIDVLAEGADYVFQGGGESDFFARHRSLGRYIPEGSKAGANAAAVYVTHRVLPLDAAHFGELQALSLRATEVFVAKAEAFCQRVAGQVQALVPFRPDSNLVCIAFNPRGNIAVAGVNRFVRALHRALSADPGRPLQLGEYFGSVTTLKRESVGDTDTDRLLAGLGLPADALGADPSEGNDRLVILRHTLMNPFLLDEHGDSPVMDGYFAFLERWISGAAEKR